jgi:TPP-dependent pyruvate/acetoin dehydrogenase alpha subunit
MAGDPTIIRPSAQANEADSRRGNAACTFAQEGAYNRGQFHPATPLASAEGLDSVERAAR